MENKFQAKTLQRRNLKNLTLGDAGNSVSINPGSLVASTGNAPPHRSPPSPPLGPPPVLPPIPPHRKPPPPPPPARSSLANYSTTSTTSTSTNTTTFLAPDHPNTKSSITLNMNMNTSSIRSRRGLKDKLPLDIDVGRYNNRQKVPTTILDEQRPTLINIRDQTTSSEKTVKTTLTTSRRPPPPVLDIQPQTMDNTTTDNGTINSFSQILLTSSTVSSSSSRSVSSTNSITTDAFSQQQQDSVSTISIPLANYNQPSTSASGSDSTQPIEFKLEDLVQLGKLGEGNSGTVQKVLHVPSSTVLSKKTIPIENNNDTVKRQILRELSIVRTIKPHPNIISFYGAYVKQGSANELIILMEYMDCGSLDKILKVYRHFLTRDPDQYSNKSWFNDPLVLSKIAYGVLNGLSYLYNNYKIIHRDIKPSNVLVGSSGEIKLCDFGVSKRVVNSIANTFVGTSTYMSPERIQGNVYSTKGDVWSLGLMLIELVTGEFPLGGDKNTPDGVLDLLQRIVNEPPPRLPDDDDDVDDPGSGSGSGSENCDGGKRRRHYPPEFRDFVNKCCVKNAKDRSSLQELLEHEFIVKYRGIGEREFRHWCKFVKAKIKEDKQIIRKTNERAKLEKQQQRQRSKGRESSEKQHL